MMIVMGVVGIIFAIVVIGNKILLFDFRFFFIITLIQFSLYCMYICVCFEYFVRKYFEINQEIKIHLIHLAWIGSKVKSDTPALPSGGLTTAIPSAANESPSGPGGVSGNPTGERSKSKSHGRSRKTKKTTVATGLSTTAAPSNDGEQEPSTADDAAKAAIKRVIRALVRRQ